MHFIIILNLASSLLFTCSSGLVAHAGTSVRAKRDDGFSGDMVVEQQDIQQVTDIQGPNHLDNLELGQMISQHEHSQYHQSQQQQQPHTKTPKDSKINILQEQNYHQHHHSSEGIRGLRCGPVLFTPKNLQDAAKKGCDLLKTKKKTIGFKRYPVIYQHSQQELISISRDQRKPKGPYFIFPVLKKGKVYKFGHRSGPYRVVFNDKCEVAGATMIRKTMDKCKGLKCYLPFRHKPIVNSVCPVDYHQ